MANRNKKTANKYSRRKEEYKKKSIKDNKDTELSKDSKKYDDDNKSWNDAGWYIPDDKIRAQVGTYAVNSVTGIPQYIDSESGELLDVHSHTEMLYGSVMSISLFPYPGVSSGLTIYGSGVSALDTACRKLYTAISSVNSKTTQYTPQSLGIAMLALGELVSLISFATRLYGVAFTYNPRNRHVPTQVIKAMGISPDDILSDLSKYRMNLNKLITAANNVRMLNDIKYFQKCWEIYANYYEDSNSGLAQYYVMKPAGYLKYVEVDPTNGSLVWVPFEDNMSATQLIQHIQTCLTNLLTSSLMNYVYTDIVNYVTKEGGNLLGFSYVGELYSVLPIMDSTFLTQVRNMTWGMFDLTGYTIAEDMDNLTIITSDIFNKHGDDAYARQITACDRVIDFPFTDNPTIDEKIDAVMYTTIVWDIDDTGKPLSIAAPDHPVLEIKVYRNTDRTPNSIPNFIDYTNEVINTYIKYAIDTEAFHIRPTLYSAYHGNAGVLNIFPVAQWNYFTIMKFQQLKNIFDFAFLGLFDAEVKGVKPY